MTAAVTGVIPAVVTPFTAGGAEIDVDALDAHVGWLHDRGIRCIAPLGTNGEGPSLSLRERLAVIERLAAHPSAMTILPGTGAAPLPEAIELGRFAAEHGAAGLLVPPPSYFPAERDGLLRYYGALLDGLGDDATILLYNVPAYTGVEIDVEDVVALRAEYGDRIGGIKDSGGDLGRTIALMRAVPGLIVLSGGDGTIAAALRAGVNGVVSALANFVPERVEAVRAAIASGRDGEAEQDLLSELRRITKAVPQRGALKALVAAVAGLPRSAVRPPQADLTEAEAEAVVRQFEALPGADREVKTGEEL